MVVANAQSRYAFHDGSYTLLCDSRDCPNPVECRVSEHFQYQTPSGRIRTRRYDQFFCGVDGQRVYDSSKHRSKVKIYWLPRKSESAAALGYPDMGRTA